MWWSDHAQNYILVHCVDAFTTYMYIYHIAAWHSESIIKGMNTIGNCSK